MRRKQGALVPFELKILSAIKDLHAEGEEKIWGLLIAKKLDLVSTTSSGSMYRALRRLEKFGYLVGSWQDITTVEGSSPRRRYYNLTVAKTRYFGTPFYVAYRTGI